MNVVAASVPAFLSVVRGSAAGEFGHTPSKRLPHSEPAIKVFQ
jgi:hypothetical protein